jgi:hypothetical protein
MAHLGVGRQGEVAGGFGAETVLLGLPGTPAPDSGAGQAVPPWRAGQGPPAPAVGRQVPDRPAAPGIRLSRQRDLQDCVAAASDALLIRAGQVGMIMAGFVPISGYKCSKNPSVQPDLNRRPLDPQARIRRLARSEGVGQGAIHLEKPSSWVGIGSGESEGVGSRSWLPGSPHADSSEKSFATAWRCRGTRKLGPLPLSAGCGSRAAGVIPPCSGSGGRGGRCMVVVACRPSSPFGLGPFEAVTEIGARAPCRVTPVAAACACVSLLYWPGLWRAARLPIRRGDAAAGGGRAK